MTATEFPVPGSEIGALATLAAILEASAPKPGNVSPGRPFHDMRFEDFLASAVAAGPVLGRAPGRAVGETILEAVRATREWTDANTNLGILLLFAPLAKAAGELDSPAARHSGLRGAVARVLTSTTVADARAVYTAIRIARPGGLGAAADQDVAEEPTMPLLDTMRLAADRDGVAAEYASDYAVSFETGVPTLRTARRDGLDWADATTECFLTLLAARPDTLIARKLGAAVAREVSGEAAAVIRAGGVRLPEGRAAIAAFDSSLRDAHNSRNPGTTADLTATALFVTLLEDGWRNERSRNPRAQ
jgi:triphosphoribosyl-dephospho-CoA synthase